MQPCSTQRQLALESALHRARDCADALLDKRRHLANVRSGLPPIVVDAEVPEQLVLIAGARRRGVVLLVRRLFDRLVLRADAARERILPAAEAVEAVDDLGALLRQILERG